MKRKLKILLPSQDLSKDFIIIWILTKYLLLHVIKKCIILIAALSIGWRKQHPNYQKIELGLKYQISTHQWSN